MSEPEPVPTPTEPTPTEPTPTEPTPTEPTPTEPAPEAIVPVAPTVPTIATMEELMASHAVLVAKETADRAALTPLTAPTPEAYRPQLFAWAAAGFPAIYVVQSFSLTPPSMCSDGVTRDAVNYAWYLLGVEIGGILANIQSMLTGITVSYSFEGNALRIHVSKA